MDDFSQLLYTVNEIPFDQSPIMKALDEIHYDILVIDPVIKQIMKWVLEHSDHTFPKTEKRWKNHLQSQFPYVTIDITDIQLTRFTHDVLRNNLHAKLRVLLQHIMYCINTRPNCIFPISFRIPTDIDRVYQNLLHKNYIDPSTYGRKARINIFRIRKYLIT